MDKQVHPRETVDIITHPRTDFNSGDVWAWASNHIQLGATDVITYPRPNLTCVSEKQIT